MKERNLDRKDRNDRTPCDRKPNRYLEILHGKRCQVRKNTSETCFEISQEHRTKNRASPLGPALVSG